MANVTVTRNPSIIVPFSRRKSLWKMVRTMLIPSKVLASFTACGGGKAKRRRRLEKYRRGQGTLQRPPLVRQSQSQSTESELPPEASTELDSSFQQMTLSGERSPRSNVQVSSQNTNQTFQTVNVIINNNRTELGLVNSSNSQPDLHNLNNENEINDQSCALETQSSIDISHLAYQNEEEHSSIISVINTNFNCDEGQPVIMRRTKKRESTDETEFHGWRKSSIDVTCDPPITLKWIPSGLQIGDKVMWVTENQPERAVVRWIGKIRGQYYSGIEFERRIGNSSGLYGYSSGLHQRLFSCDLGFGRFVPVDELVLYSDFHDKGVKAGFICVICRDDFLDLQDYEGAAGDGNMVATKCGHLYHEFCLEQWFSKARTRGDNGHHCPHCQSVIKLDDIIRLFPAQV